MPQRSKQPITGSSSFWATPRSQYGTSTVIGPKKPTLPHRVANADPISLPVVLGGERGGGIGAPSRAHVILIVREARRIGKADEGAERDRQDAARFAYVVFAQRTDDDAHRASLLHDEDGRGGAPSGKRATFRARLAVARATRLELRRQRLLDPASPCPPRARSRARRRSRRRHSRDRRRRHGARAPPPSRGAPRPGTDARRCAHSDRSHRAGDRWRDRTADRARRAGPAGDRPGRATPPSDPSPANDPRSAAAAHRRPPRSAPRPDRRHDPRSSSWWPPTRRPAPRVRSRRRRGCRARGVLR